MKSTLLFVASPLHGWNKSRTNPKISPVIQQQHRLYIGTGKFKGNYFSGLLSQRHLHSHFHCHCLQETRVLCRNKTNKYSNVKVKEQVFAAMCKAGIFSVTGKQVKRTVRRGETLPVSMEYFGDPLQLQKRV